MAGPHHDPYWPRASAWLRPRQSEGRADIVILGLPSRLGSISPGRCDLAPGAIRESLVKLSTYDLTNRAELSTLSAWDFGDTGISDLRIEDAFEPSREAVRSALEIADACVILGGDNAVTRPGVHGLNVPLDRSGLITLDAHLDLRHLESGLTNGNPVRALLKDGLPGQNIVQIGIQSFANSKAYHAIAEEAGITLVTMEDIHREGIITILESVVRPLLNRVDAAYFDLDLDVMDRVFAPGCPGSRPGGLAPHQVISAARWMGRQPKVRAMDLVELDPELDERGVTALTAATALLAFSSGFAERA